MVLSKGEKIEILFDKSENSYDIAKLAFENGRYFSSINRIYYACFYLVEALLLTKDLKSRKHSGVISLFNQHFVHEGDLDYRWFEFFRFLFKERQNDDYDYVRELNGEQVKKFLNEAEEFIDVIKDKIKEEL